MPQETAGGVLCPGGSYSNLLAITTARNYFFPHIREVCQNPYIPTIIKYLSRYPRIERSCRLFLFLCL